MRFELALPAAPPHRHRQLATDLTFTFGTPAQGPAAPLLKRAAAPAPRAPRASPRPTDFYSVGRTDAQGRPATRGLARFAELAWAVLFEHTPHSGRSALLGPTGHCERFNAWSHLVAFVAFAAFAALRQAGSPKSVAGAMTSAAAWSAASVFFASALYHITAPDKEFSRVSRFVDFLSIYTSIVLTSSADLAVVTKGFEEVPLVAIVDVPLAGLAVAGFFLLRRWHLASSATWVENHSHAHEHGLFCRHHDDMHHQPLRSSTSLTLTFSFVLAFPVAYTNLPGVASLFVFFQLVAFLVVLCGMVMDTHFSFNSRLLQGSLRCFAFPARGFVINSHGLWHVLSVLSVGVSVAARELALAA